MSLSILASSSSDRSRDSFWSLNCASLSALLDALFCAFRGSTGFEFTIHAKLAKHMPTERNASMESGQREGVEKNPTVHTGNLSVKEYNSSATHVSSVHRLRYWLLCLPLCPTVVCWRSAVRHSG